MTWIFTDLEFKVLCEDHGLPTVPHPFDYTSRIRLENDYLMAKAVSRGRLAHEFDADIDEFGRTLNRPDVYVVAQSWTDSDFDNPADRTKVLVLRRGTRGYMVYQQPGETREHSAGFEVGNCYPGGLGEAALIRMPWAESGRQQDIPVPLGAPAAKREYVPGGSLVSDNDEPEDGDSYRAAAFFGTAAARSGYVRVHQGRSKFGPRGRVDMGMFWRDLPGDGRYVIPMNHPAPTATGMGTEELTAWIDEQVSLVMSRLEWNQENE
ncbi:ESX secretion-associated protein EspG [Nocardia flavorosea]|uniref:ESX secretion-associated protein EspG n=1 Tax=Nocardia flavorosea TaxID=53429 RepID=A0A846YP23_9NOCA|nr:ESX secretion-associated protein EspG [Nocardia flavorosea]NKY60865.1 ESX secretion-associated protein EspG [Nocardia flavorosea]